MYPLQASVSISLLTLSSQLRMARMVFSISSSTVQPRRSAPVLITSREQPAANYLSLYFFVRRLTCTSMTL